MGLLSAGVNVVSSVLLVRSFGLVGVALGTLVSTLVVDLGMVVTRTCRLYSVSGKEYVQSVVRPLVVPLLLQSVVCSVLHNALPSLRLGGVVLASGVSVLVFVAGYMVVGLNTNERKRITDKVMPRLAFATIKGV